VFGTRFAVVPAGTDQQKKESKMLVLSRQRDESIMIGDEVEVTIVDVRGDKVRLGINAPRRIAVHRKEIYEAIQREKAQKKQAEDKAEEPKGEGGKTEGENTSSEKSET
jgi:carbon storage regulator